MKPDQKLLIIEDTHTFATALKGCAPRCSVDVDMAAFALAAHDSEVFRSGAANGCSGCGTRWVYTPP